MPTSQKISFREMTDEDIAEYRRWFQDHELGRRMNFPANLWTNYVRNTNISKAWSATIEDRLKAHLQLDLNQEGPSYIAIAVCPTLRIMGIGTRALLGFVNGPATMRPIDAYIEQNNTASLTTFKAAGFVPLSETPDEDGMIAFRLAIR